MEPVIYGSKSVCIEISFVSSGDFGEANKRTRKYRGDPQNGEKPCAADHIPYDAILEHCKIRQHAITSSS